MQDKINTLISLISDLPVKKKNYAIKIITDLVNVINSQEKEIKGLQAWKTNNKLSEVECELQKYVHILIYHGYSEGLIKMIRPEALMFVAKNRKQIGNIEPYQMKTIDLMLMNFEFEFKRLPKNYDELKKTITDVES